MVIHMKIKWFSCETFCASIHSANGSSDGGSQVCIMSQTVHQASTHSSFCSRKWLGVFLLPPPPWMGCQSITGLPPNINFASTYLYTWEDTEALWEYSVSPKNTIQCSQTGLKPRLLEIEKKYKNQITGCLHRLLTTLKMDNYWNWNIVFKLTCTWCSVKE